MQRNNEINRMTPTRLTSFVLALFLFTFACVERAQALIVCSISSPGFSAGYVPANLTTSITSSTFSVTCSRDNAGGPANANVQYNVSVDNGINALGTQNRAVLAGSILNYNLATDPACATPWQGATAIPTPVAQFTIAKNTVVTNSYTYYGCILPGQTVLPPEGTYTDTVTMTFTPGRATGASSFISGPLPVNIVAPATCNVSTMPSNINFSYTAFNPAPILANASFGVRCTTSLAYSISLDTTIGVVTGLNYTLGLDTVANTVGFNPLANVGTGVPQTLFINGSMAAGQPGACASSTLPCTGTQVRTLTITY